MPQDLNTPDIAPRADEEKDRLAELIAQLSAESARQRRSALRALGRLGAEAVRALPALIGAFADRDMHVRAEGVEVLVRLGKEAVPALVECLRTDPPDVRRVAIVTLGRIGADAHEALPLLEEALADPYLAAPAAEALERIAPRSRSGVQWLRQVVPWLVLGWVLLALAGGATVGLDWVGQQLLGPGGQAAGRCSAVLAGLGSTLGAILGYARGSWRAWVLGPLVLGLGGAAAGLLLGGLIAGIVEPVAGSLRP